jgi:hypothetical protein
MPPGKSLRTVESLRAFVRQAVAETTITDIHTHLFPPSHGRLLLWGIDELLTYHYLVAELFTIAPRDLTPEAFWQMPKSAQADAVWAHVFLRHGALSEAARGVVTTLSALGLDPAARDLAAARRWFQQQNADDYLARVFQLAGVDCAVMTNDPFQPAEVAHWDAGRRGTDRLRPALRIDPLLADWPAAARTLAEAGYDVRQHPNEKTWEEVRRFLRDWSRRIAPVYYAASLGPDFRYGRPARAGDLRQQMLDRAILPAAVEAGVPFAMMIGVRKRVNPALREAGDAVGAADVTAVQNLCAAHGDVKFLVTMLSRVNQHELCVCARKFGNLHLFGCWWFCNDPSIIDEITRMRLELLGATFTANHSDARVLDQLVYKWSHTRQVVAAVLADKYAALHRAGWRPTEEEVRREVRALFGGAFDAFLAK